MQASFSIFLWKDVCKYINIDTDSYTQIQWKPSHRQVFLNMTVFTKDLEWRVCVCVLCTGVKFMNHGPCLSCKLFGAFTLSGEKFKSFLSNNANGGSSLLRPGCKFIWLASAAVLWTEHCFPQKLLSRLKCYEILCMRTRCSENPAHKASCIVNAFTEVLFIITIYSQLHCCWLLSTIVTRPPDQPTFFVVEWVSSLLGQSLLPTVYVGFCPHLNWILLFIAGGIVLRQNYSLNNNGAPQCKEECLTVPFNLKQCPGGLLGKSVLCGR